MKNNKTLLSFVFGMLSVIAFIPIIESLVEIICGYLEILKISSAKKVLKGNNEIMELQAAQQETDTVVMGFQAPNDEYLDDDEYFEDKKIDKIKPVFH